MAARRCKRLMLATAALAASLAASKNRYGCCDAFVTPSFRPSIAAAATGPVGRSVRHQHPAAAAPTDAEADAEACPGAVVDASEEAAVLDSSSLEVENVVVIGRCEQDLERVQQRMSIYFLNVSLICFMSHDPVWSACFLLPKAPIL